jgi:erythromycin esterase-like protein
MSRYGDEVAALSAPLGGADDFDVLLDRVGTARVVMLGEASHGTHEYYHWRAQLTQRLIEEAAFSFVAVEGDWPDCDRVDRSVRLEEGAPEDPRAALATFERWPTWMWANDEVADFCQWLRWHNAQADPEVRAGFHGLDVYSLWESLREILVYLREHDPEQVPAALAAYQCFEPYAEDAQLYALATRFVAAGCENEVVDLLVRLRSRAQEGGGPERFRAWQNAEVVAGAERYYRAMVRGGRDSWNVRDRHMDATLARLLDHYGPESKAVVWAHNTHAGDARATDMGGRGEVNIGQLARERHGADDVVLVGFGSHHGTVVAGDGWGAPMEEMAVPPAREAALEGVLHTAAPARSLLVFPRDDRPDLLTDTLDHRAIGVVYHPERDRWSNYVPTVLGDRYDAFCWFDETRAVAPMAVPASPVFEPETYPTGV